MSPLVAASIAIGSICLTIGALHLVVGRRVPESRLHLWIALAAAFAAGNAFAEPFAYTATAVGPLNTGFKWEVLFQGLCWIALVWYVALYARSTRRWLAAVVSAGYAVALLVHVLSPYGVLFSEITGVAWYQMPWGERYSLPQGAASPWRVVADLSTLLLIVFVVDAWLQLVRRRQRRRAIRLAAATVALLAALVHGILVDLAVVQQPYLISVAFLATVLIMGLDLADEAVKAGQLAREVALREQRWGTLLEKVHLLVAGLDGAGRMQYVNPFLCSTTGFPAEQLIGRPFDQYLPAADRDRVTQGFQRALDGEAAPYTEARILTRGGDERIVLWSNVVMRSADGAVTGSLSIGADVTERREAEAARDAAMRELEVLKERLEDENLYLREEIQLDRDFSDIVGESDALRYVLYRVEQVAPTDTTVLVQGETGVGKEVVARAIHETSHRSDKPFVTVNCAALPPNLIESELFGHEAGAFTGATGRRRGRFELANGGTIFLDEIGDLPLELQSRLLHVLQEGDFERVGSSATTRVDVRVIAATNRNLTAEVAAGRFREDLFYRLNVYPITVPPLRERRGDVSLLVEHFVRRVMRQTGRVIEEIPASLLRHLTEYDWPGNVRELRNVVERAVITSPGPTLQLPEALPRQAAPPRAVALTSATNDLGLESLETVERRHIEVVLERVGRRVGGRDGAAEILGLHPNTLRSRMKKLGIRARAEPDQAAPQHRAAAPRVPRSP